MPGRATSCGRTPTSSRSSNAVIPAARPTSTPRRTWPRSGRRLSPLLRPDPPADHDRLLGLQHDQVLAADERVRRAGHRLDGDRRAATFLFERVTGEDL